MAVTCSARKCPPSPLSILSRKSHRSIKRLSKSRSCKSLKNTKTLRNLLTDFDFFSVISTRKELGMDFLREMNSPICTSKSILLPIDLYRVTPGRCLILSPYGYSSNMSFQCDACSSLDKLPTGTIANQHNKSDPSLNTPKELFSITLTFYHNVDKVVQHKNFYLSLLSNSMESVRQSFCQPSLLYTYIVLKSFGHNIFPIFRERTNALSMYLIFKNNEIHIGETSLRLFLDNLTAYLVTLDCVQKTYVLKMSPILPEETHITISQDSICDAICTLDCTDEIKEEIIKGVNLVSHMDK
nr:hypothetical protein [Bovine gammaherpesvirus 4]